MTPATRQWVKKAEDDYRAAVWLEAENKRLHDQVCFHCQQAAEKYLKAILNERGQNVPRIHDCDRLLSLIHAIPLPLIVSRRGLLYLNGFAVLSRYPGDSATARQARAALRWTVHVRYVCRSWLGLKV